MLHSPHQPASRNHIPSSMAEEDMRRSATEQPDVTMAPAGLPVTHGPTGTTRSGKKCRATMRGQGPTPCPSCDAVCLQGQHVPPGTKGRYYVRCVEAKGEVDFAMGEAMRLLRDWKSNTNPRAARKKARSLHPSIKEIDHCVGRGFKWSLRGNLPRTTRSSRFC